MAPPPEPEVPEERPLSPFQQYAPRADQLDTAAGRTDSRQVMAIVGALGFMMMAAVVIVSLTAVGIFTMGNMVTDGALIAAMTGDEEAGVIILDTGLVLEPIVEERPARTKAVKDEEEPDPADAAPTRADAIIILAAQGNLFHSIEVRCPQHNIRTRASFRNHRAVARGLPTNEACQVTFQGSAPVTTQIRGGETKTCYSFNPVNCR